MSRVIANYIRQMPFILSRPDFDSEVYNNCLIIQKCCNDLDARGLWTEQERQIIRLFFEGHTTSGVARELGISRITISLMYRNITNRLAFILGGEFTDTAVIERVVDTL